MAAGRQACYNVGTIAVSIHAETTTMRGERRREGEEGGQGGRGREIG